MNITIQCLLESIKGQYATKWCDDENNIKTYLETGEVKMFDKKITL